MDAAVRSRVLRQLTYGLYIVTASDGPQVAAGAVNWITQISIEPPLVSVGLARSSGIAVLAERVGRFAVNTLGAGQEDLAKAFFSPAVRQGDTLNGVKIRSGNDGMPILTQVPSAFECTVLEVHRPGDHVLVVGRVTTVHEHNQLTPLVLATTGWFYGG
jgi:flavin reductase (DIM6/NTAB) family NADH-FMN oxidoreductase RutF